MRLSTRIIERGINAIMIFFLLMTTCIYSCIAQELATHVIPALNKSIETSKAIHYAPNVNLTAKAVPMNSAINSPYEELKPAFAPHGDKLYFSRSFHPNNTFGENDPEDIWYSRFDSTDNIWSEPIRMPGYLNNNGPNYIENVSMSGDTIILGNQYLKNSKMRDGTSYSVNINGEWSAPTPITILKDYNFSDHANHFVSLRSGVIISAVERRETSGLRDLYVSFWNGKYATEPVNMGSVINSELEESSPFLACDNKTLYFASKGHNGHGGFDIFVTERLDDSWTNWSVPQNLGPAVNGTLDDEFFSITHCGRYAIFTKQVNIHNVDLFKIPTIELFGKTAPSDIKIAKKARMTLRSL